MLAEVRLTAANDIQSTAPVSELRDRLRTSTNASAKSEFRRNGLVRWWHHSTLRKVVDEIGKFPRRMVALRQLPNWALYRLPSTHSGLPPNSFLQSCSDCIQELRGEFPWAGYLDAQMLARAYAEGARWAYDNFCKETRKES